MWPKEVPLGQKMNTTGIGGARLGTSTMDATGIGGVNLATSTVNQSFVGVSNGLVAWWKIDGPWTDATHFADSVGTNAATVNTAVPFPGKIGQGLYITGEGAGGAVMAVDSSSTSPTSTWTFTAWAFWKDKASGNSSIFKKDTYETNSGYQIYVGADHQLQMDIGTSTAWHNVYCNQAGTFPVNQWAFVVFKTDGTSVTGYINNVLCQTWANTRPIAYPTSAVLGLGRNGTADNGNWYGVLDDLRIYNRALTAYEMTQLYNLGL